MAGDKPAEVVLEMSLSAPREGIVSRVSKACHFFTMSRGRSWEERQGECASANGFPQFAAEDFTGGGFGDNVDETYFTRLFVGSEAVGDEGAEFFFHFSAVGKSVTQRDEGHGDFPSVEVGTADDSTLFHRGMFE